MSDGSGDQITASTKRIGELHRETYAAWIRRQCDRWGIAWREMYGVPMDKPKGNTNG